MTIPLPHWLAAATVLAAGCAAAAPQAYTGLCDASAAVALDAAGHFAVADDESNVLRIYQRTQPAPMGALDLTDHLGNREDGKTHEADIEGAARVGDRIYWISSHARKGKSGKAAPYRQRFFATRILPSAAVPQLQAVGTPARGLLQALLRDPRFAVLVPAEARGPEADGGLNIEGLAARSDGSLLIGFRNPQPGGKALLVPLRNPAAVIDQAAAPDFGDPLLLDLGGRGVRSIEQVGEALLLAAGPHGTAKASTVRPPFALYRWSGDAGAAPVFAGPLGSGTQRPEALFLDTASGTLLALSDDGDETVAGHDCKDKAVPARDKRFRAFPVALPPAR